MSNTDIISKIESLREWEALAADATAVIETLKDDIKREMDKRGVEELEAGQYIARYTSVVSNRLDTSSMKKKLPDVYAAFVKQVTSRRFSIC